MFKSLHNVLKEKKSPISTILAVKKNFFVVKSWNILYTIVKIFCSSVEFFVQSGNILWCVEIFCAVCKYFAQVWKYSIWKSANLCSNWIFQIRSELVVDMQMAPGSHSLVITIIQPHRNTNTNINTNTKIHIQMVINRQLPCQFYIAKKPFRIIEYFTGASESRS